ncbi:CGNR zinc finger domain-containing protein [Cohnella cholangitidis]|uniref:CGNR zinc finger domain-containing protein n=1 Tax=Cohnella cholangitidis TaxID=2598458 RepID=A0A7G5C653_9BACL|nr:CGNR zinc finger domain-containing protein [Cohnella cholangitidis]QMV44687.1 CGNR zinc finger domain-containing protein [Cohnella cholangitidis]
MDKSIYTLGGTAWINLLNTIVMHNKQPTDLLADPAAAVEWLEANQLLYVPVTRLDAAALAQIRQSLYPVRELGDRIISDIEQHEALSERVYIELKTRLERLNIKPAVSRNHDARKLELSYRGVTAIDQIHLVILQSVLDTLNHYSADRIRKCEHAECILRFIDVSKSGRRRWCSMELCGNRHKAAQYYEKNKKQKA